MKPHSKTLAKLLLEAGDARQRDEELLRRGDEVLTRLRAFAETVEERVRLALQAGTRQPAERA